LKGAGPGDEPRRRESDRDPEAPAPRGIDPAAPSPAGTATWGGEGGAGDYRGGPTTSPGEAERDPDGNPELM